MDAEIGGLEAQQTRAFDNILDGARNRGLGFSGIPAGEQAEYVASEFLPAVARVRSSGNEVKSSLFGALADINRSQRSEASGIRQQELDRAEQIRQFNAQLEAQRAAERRAAAQQASYASLLGGGGDGSRGAAPDPTSDLQRFLKQQYSANPRANRQTQDNWVKIWAARNGVDANAAGDPYGIWKAYNTWYPWEKYADSVRRAPLKQVQSGGGLRVLQNYGGL